MRFLTSSGFSSTSKPAMLALPVVGGRKHVRTRIVVVFPAPFGPRKPTICPFSTSKEISSTATVRAYRFVRPSTLIILLSQKLRILPWWHNNAPNPGLGAMAYMYELPYYWGQGRLSNIVTYQTG